MEVNHCQEVLQVLCFPLYVFFCCLDDVFIGSDHGEIVEFRGVNEGLWVVCVNVIGEVSSGGVVDWPGVVDVFGSV